MNVMQEPALDLPYGTVPRASRSDGKTFFGFHLYTAGRCCKNTQSYKGPGPWNENPARAITWLVYFNRFACFWPKGYQLGSLGKSHQNGDYLKQAMRKIVFPQESNLQPLDYRSTALPLELEKTPPHMRNFGYLNPATCLLYDCNNKSIKMFFDVCRPEF